MFPELFTLGPVTIYTYGLALAAALIASGAYVRSVLVGRGVDVGSVYNVLFAAVLGGIVGARALYVATHWSEYAACGAGRLWEIFFLAAGGLAFQGGVLGGALAVWLVVRYERLPVGAVMDAAAPALALGAAIGRLGCFANGCCAGAASTAWYAVPFVGYAEPRVPVQLLDMGYNLALFAALAWLARRPGGPVAPAAQGGPARPAAPEGLRSSSFGKRFRRAVGAIAGWRREGDLLWLWFAGYSVARFTVEFLRRAPGAAQGAAPGAAEPALGLNPRVLFGLTAPQLVALTMAAFGVAMLARGRFWAAGRLATHERLADRAVREGEPKP